MRVSRLAPVMLAACSAEPAPENIAAAPSPVVATPAPEPAAAPAPHPGKLKTFGDWTVGCDNTALCTMTSLGPEDGGPLPDVTMTLLRQTGPEGRVDLWFQSVRQGTPVLPAAVAVDGARIALPPRLGGPAAFRVAAAMANGRMLAVVEPGGKVRARIPLAGASAAMRWIDAQQGRAGTVTALVAKGPAAATTTPGPRAAPVIRAVAPSGTPAVPSAAQLAAMRRRAACEQDGPLAGEAGEPVLHALGGGATLVMLPCSLGAYNLSSTLFVLRDGAVAPARADAPTGLGPTPEAEDRLTSVVNARWRDGGLTSYAKGRGLGDCGVKQTLVWDGNRFRLAEQSAMSECRGNPDFVTTWRAQVVRGQGAADSDRASAR